MKRRKKLEGALGTWVIVASQKMFRMMSPSRAERLGAFLFKTVGRCLKKRRERVLDNLEIAFPEWTPAERERVMWANFEHFGRVMADFFRNHDRSLEQIEAMVTFEGREHLEEAFRRGKGVILLTGHFGNWELVGSWFSRSGYPMSVVIRDADTEDVNDAVNKMRRASGTNLIARGNAAKDILSRLRKNEMVGILPDQNSKEIFIPFFGKPAGTVLGPGVMAERTGATVLTGYCVRVGVNKYHIHCDPPYEPTGEFETKGEGAMRHFHDRLEEGVRKYPEQYLWMHDRWRSARRKKLL